jgi:ArsR family transcriptional regulator, lead/cadmium/zinc/bismuth-responsive transcriptional repressor
MPTKTKLKLKSEAAICPGGTTLDTKGLLAMKEKVQANGDVDALADFFAIAGNSQRLRMLLYLTEARELCVCDLAELLDMGMTAVSAHLNKMKLQGVLKTRRDAQMIYYSIADEERMKVLSHAFADLRKAMKL